MRKIFLLLFALSTSALAETDPNWKDFSAKYPASRHKVSKIVLEHKVVTNVQEACNAERKRLGKDPYPYSVDACTFWTHKMTGNRCTIITGPKTSQAELGHELRHCLEGNYHQ